MSKRNNIPSLPERKVDPRNTRAIWAGRQKALRFA